MVNIMEEVINIKLREAAAKPFFSICIIREVAESRGAGIFQLDSMKEFKELQKAHCIDYKDMSPEMMAEVKRLSSVVMDSFPRKTILQRLISLFK
jgi:hypothetical protein